MPHGRRDPDSLRGRGWQYLVSIPLTVILPNPKTPPGHLIALGQLDPVFKDKEQPWLMPQKFLSMA